MRLAALVPLAFLPLACVPDYAFSPSDAGTDAADAFVEAAPTATLDGHVEADAPPPAFVFSPFTLAQAGAAQAPTGLAQQEHLVWAAHDGRAWFFYVDDDTTKIKTRVSQDLVTWSDGDPVPLTTGVDGGSTGGYGSNFAVAYADLGGADVVHLVVSERATTDVGSTYHVRATIAGGHLHPSAPALVVAGGGCDVDGPTIVVAPDGHVYDGTGWYTDASGTKCDMNVYRSDAVDTGAATWSAGFASRTYFGVSGYSASHRLVALPTGQLLAAWSDQGGDPVDGMVTYGGVSWSHTTDANGNWLMPQSLLFSTSAASGPHGYDDWQLCRAGTAAHAVRHVIDTNSPQMAVASSFEHLVYDGAAWHSAAAPAPLASFVNTGLALVGDGNAADGVVAFVLGTDGAIQASRWTDASGAWSAWWAIAPAAARKWLAGSGCGGPGAVVTWTEGSASTQAILGADVSPLVRGAAPP